MGNRIIHKDIKSWLLHNQIMATTEPLNKNTIKWIENIISLATKGGIDISGINTDKKPTFIVIDVIKEANRTNRFEALKEVVNQENT